MKKIAAPTDFSLNAIRAASLTNLRAVVAWSPMVTETSSAAGLVTHYHNLGAIPTHLYALPWASATVWRTEDDLRQWNESQIVFHISANSTRVDVSAGLI